MQCRTSAEAIGDDGDRQSWMHCLKNIMLLMNIEIHRKHKEDESIQRKAFDDMTMVQDAMQDVSRGHKRWWTQAMQIVSRGYKRWWTQKILNRLSKEYHASDEHKHIMIPLILFDVLKQQLACLGPLTNPKSPWASKIEPPPDPVTKTIWTSATT